MGDLTDRTNPFSSVRVELNLPGPNHRANLPHLTKINVGGKCSLDLITMADNGRLVGEEEDQVRRAMHQIGSAVGATTQPATWGCKMHLVCLHVAAQPIMRRLATAMFTH